MHALAAAPDMQETVTAGRSRICKVGGWTDWARICKLRGKKMRAGSGLTDPMIEARAGAFSEFLRRLALHRVEIAQQSDRAAKR